MTGNVIGSYLQVRSFRRTPGSPTTSSPAPPSWPRGARSSPATSTTPSRTRPGRVRSGASSRPRSMTTREYAALVALLDEVYEGTTTVVSGLNEESFDQRTRTELWSVKDLLFHQMCDAQRALVVFTTEPDGLADTTAVSYWSAWQPGQPGADAHARYAAKAAAAYGGSHFLVTQWARDEPRGRARGPSARPGRDGRDPGPRPRARQLRAHPRRRGRRPSPRPHARDALPGVARRGVRAGRRGPHGTSGHRPPHGLVGGGVLSSRAPAASRSATEDRESLGAAVAVSSPSSADGVPSRGGHREGRRGPGRLRAHEPAGPLDKAIP